MLKFQVLELSAHEFSEIVRLLYKSFLELDDELSQVYEIAECSVLWQRIETFMCQDFELPVFEL